MRYGWRTYRTSLDYSGDSDSATPAWRDMSNNPSINISIKDIQPFVRLLEACAELVRARQTGDDLSLTKALDYIEHVMLEVGMD